MTSPDDGHQFHISVRIQGSYGVKDESGHQDSDIIGEPFRLTVRAWDLRAACLFAAQKALRDWTIPDNPGEDGKLYTVAKVLRDEHAHAYYEALLTAYNRGGFPGDQPKFNPDVTDVEMWLDQARALDDAGLLK